MRGQPSTKVSVELDFAQKQFNLPAGRVADVVNAIFQLQNSDVVEVRRCTDWIVNDRKIAPAGVTLPTTQADAKEPMPPMAASANVSGASTPAAAAGSASESVAGKGDAVGDASVNVDEKASTCASIVALRERRGEFARQGQLGPAAAVLEMPSVPDASRTDASDAADDGGDRGDEEDPALAGFNVVHKRLLRGKGVAGALCLTAWQVRAHCARTRCTCARAASPDAACLGMRRRASWWAPSCWSSTAVRWTAFATPTSLPGSGRQAQLCRPERNGLEQERAPCVVNAEARGSRGWCW